MHNFVNNNYKEIMLNLEYGRRELPLMLKIVDYLRSIDSRLKSNSDSYNIMVIYYTLNNY